MSESSAVARGRVAAERGMRDTCRIVSGVTQGPIDETTGLYPDPTPTYSYQGKCKVKAENTGVHDIEAGTQILAEQGLILSLPIATSLLVGTDHVAEITAVHPRTGDPQLIGKKFRIEGPAHQTYATARRLRVEEVS